MAKEEIVEKLNRFITEHNPLSEECQVVYLLVQIRKLLDYDRDHWQRGSFTLLRFYCDWIVHTEKTRITESIKSIMDKVYGDVKRQIENPAMTKAMSPVMRFAYMEDLRNEMSEYLKERSVDISNIEGGNWISFVGLLVKVLENQPIYKPNDDIALFTFIPATERCVRGTIYFTNPINGYDHYNFGNVY